jgi:hypothetical protein
MEPKYDKFECAGCVYGNGINAKCNLRPKARAKRCRSLPQMVNGRDLLVQPRNVKERHFCDICDVIFEGEAGKHVNDEHGEDYHSSESMIEFEERHISEVD